MSTRRALGILCLVLATACGTTVDLTQAPGGSDLSVPQPQQSGTGDGTTGALPGGGTGSGPQTGGTSGSVAGPGSPTAPGTGPSTAPTGVPVSRTAVGMTKDTINVGVVYYDTDDLPANGATGTEQGSGLLQQRVLAQWINARGGIAGRKIRLVEHKINVADNPATAAQAACTAFSQDNKVYAVLGQSAAAYVPCLGRAGVITVAAGVDGGMQRSFDQFADTYYAPTSFETTSYIREQAGALHRAGWLTPSAKIGVVAFDAPDFRVAYNESLVPAFTRYGAKVTDVVWVPYTDLASYGNTLASIQSAALRFATDGITHVMFMDANGVGANYFMQNASTQGYYPRYGFSSSSSPGTLALNYGPEVLHGAVGMGWMPTWDLAQNTTFNSAGRLCEQIMSASGQAPRSDSDRELQGAHCSEFFFLRDVLARTAGYDRPSFRATVESMADNPTSSAHGMTDGYGRGKHWGAKIYHDLAYVEACSCFRYGARRTVAGS
jgi:ABC-type branched-subunit amino acid transport system substrate-binding protein